MLIKSLLKNNMTILTLSVKVKEIKEIAKQKRLDELKKELVECIDKAVEEKK